MEFLIGIAIAVVVAGIVKSGKSHPSQQTHANTEEERRRKEADEIVTVILPTINHDR